MHCSTCDTGQLSCGAGRQTTPSAAYEQGSASQPLLLSSRSSGHDLMHAASDEMQRRIKVLCQANYPACMRNALLLLLALYRCPPQPSSHARLPTVALAGSTPSSATSESWTALPEGGRGPACCARYPQHMLHDQTHLCRNLLPELCPATYVTHCKV